MMFMTPTVPQTCKIMPLLPDSSVRPYSAILDSFTPFLRILRPFYIFLDFLYRKTFHQQL